MSIDEVIRISGICYMVCVCVPVLAEAERVGRKCDRSAANRSGIVFLLGYKSTHTCEP